jgi:two-component system, cell cycle sensor histidine kinase and response regulator CckA
MEKNAYTLEQSLRTRNTGVLMSLVLIPSVLVFMYIDHVSPILSGILGWRMAALVPLLLFLPYAFFFFEAHKRLATPLHIAQLAGLMIMMCGISAGLMTRPGFPEFGRTGLISSLLVCIFGVFVFAGSARTYFFAIVVPPLAAMDAYVVTVGKLLPQIEKTWFISNPSAVAIVLGVLAVYQETSNRREFRARTELRLAEESLRKSEKKFRDLFDHAEIGMFRSRIDGSRFLDVNRKFLEIFGRSREEMVGGSSEIHWADPRERAQMVRILTRDGRVTNYECGMLDARGTLHNCLTSLRLDSEGVLEGSLVDVTERKQLEAEKLELERRIASAKKLESLGILAGGVAHNFNNLLAVILGNAEMLRDMQPAGSESAVIVNEITKAGYRSRSLIDQLLAMGRRQVLELRPLDLNEVIRDCSGMLRKALRENIKINYHLSGSSCPVTADPGRIEEVLLNLALNAQDAISREGQLTIATAEVVLERKNDSVPPGMYVLLAVSDTGEGMGQETMAKIFDPFFTTKEPGKGTGLGLSTVYGVVKQHKGSIEVESRQGAGTRFSIYFPRTELPLQGKKTESGQPIGGNETILLVEDEDSIRRLVSRQLSALGYTVLEASDGTTALKVFEEHTGVVDLLLTDVVMPYMNGRELRDRLHFRAPAMKVLYMSGHGHDVVTGYVADGGEMPLIAKPFSSQDIASRVRSILDRGQ